MTIALILALLAAGVSIALILFWKEIISFITPILARASFAVLKFIYTARGWIARVVGAPAKETDPVVIDDDEIEKMVSCGVLTREEANTMRRGEDLYIRVNN